MASMAQIPLTISPDPDDPIATQAWVDVHVGGIAARLLLDTGARHTSLPAVLLDSTAVLPGPPTRGVFGVDADSPTTTVPELVVGDLVVHDLEVGVQSDAEPHPLLGTDVFAGHQCSFRFSTASLLVDEPDHAADWNDLPTSTGHVMIDVSWLSLPSPITVRAVWDTGAGITIVDRDWAEQHPEIVRMLEGVSEGTDATGTIQQTQNGILAASRIGGLDFAEQDCGLVDLGPVNARLAEPLIMIIGLPLIAAADWVIDFAGRRWALSR